VYVSKGIADSAVVGSPESERYCHTTKAGALQDVSTMQALHWPLLVRCMHARVPVSCLAWAPRACMNSDGYGERQAYLRSLVTLPFCCCYTCANVWKIDLEAGISGQFSHMIIASLGQEYLANRSCYWSLSSSPVLCTSSYLGLYVNIPNKFCCPGPMLNDK